MFGRRGSRRAAATAAASRCRMLHHAQIGALLVPALGEEFPRLLVGQRRNDDDVLTLLPVHGRRHLVPVRELQGVDDAQDLVEVAPGAGRIGEDGADLPAGIDDEHRPHRESVVGLRMDHAVERGDGAIRIADERKPRARALRRFDVVGPAAMAVHRIHGQADHLHAAALEFGPQLLGVAELGGAHGREIPGMGEKDAPGRPQPFVEAEGAGGGRRGEVRRGIAELQCHGNAPVADADGTTIDISRHDTNTGWLYGYACRAWPRDGARQRDITPPGRAPWRAVRRHPAARR